MKTMTNRCAVEMPLSNHAMHAPTMATTSPMNATVHLLVPTLPGKDSGMQEKRPPSSWLYRFVLLFAVYCTVVLCLELAGVHVPDGLMP